MCCCLNPLTSSQKRTWVNEYTCEYSPRLSVVSCSLAWGEPFSHYPRLQVGPTARFRFPFCNAHPVFSYLLGALLSHFKCSYFRELKQGPWLDSRRETCRYHFSPRLRAAWVSLGARADLQERSPRFPSKNSFRPRLMLLRRAVYRTAAFNPTLIKHFKCSYRNSVTNPNSTLLTQCRFSLQNPSSTPFMGKAGELAWKERLQPVKQPRLYDGYRE